MAKNGELVMVASWSLASKIISLNHDYIYAAHPGRKRILDILSLQNWWPEMGKVMRNYVSKSTQNILDTLERGGGDEAPEQACRSRLFPLIRPGPGSNSTTRDEPPTIRAKTMLQAQPPTLEQ
jgi:hypothetical protein